MDSTVHVHGRFEMAKIGVQAMMLKTEFEQQGAYATLKRLGDVGVPRRRALPDLHDTGQR
jgi:hypothetical protein